MLYLRDFLDWHFQRFLGRIRVLEEYRTLGGDNLSHSEMDYRMAIRGKQLSENDLKVLQPDSELMRRRKSREAAIRAAIAKDPRLQETYGGAWQRLANLLEQRKQIDRVYALLENDEAFSPRLFWFARALVRLADETAKPDADRMDGYHEARLPALKRSLLANLPVNEDLEIRTVAESLASFEKEMGGSSELVRKMLGGRRPGDRAAELVHGSRLGDIAVRRALLEGGRPAMAASNDPMIALARLVDGPSRQVRSQYEDIGEQIRQERLRVATAIRAVAGPNAYPDATDTPRLSFGRVINPDPETLENTIFWPLTCLFWSLQDRPSIAPPQIRSPLEPRSIRVRRGLKFDTPFLFGCDVDATFGNSGSPVLNRQGKLIGVLYRADQATYLTHEYDQQLCRPYPIHIASVFEVLLNVYGALELAQELRGTDEKGTSLVRWN
jgi:hypothetical protein